MTTEHKSTEHIIVETRGRVGIIRLNRPAALNALNAALMRELAASADALESDDAIGCMVITGSEKAFAAGADGHDALRVAVPGNVVDGAGKHRVLAAGRVYGSRLPDSHDARHVAAGNLEAVGREPSDGRGRRVARVLDRVGRVVDRPHKDGLARLDRGRDLAFVQQVRGEKEPPTA